MGFTEVTIDGNKYMIELESYRDRDLVDFSPRATTGSDSILFSELGLYQAIHQTSWHHGAGFPWMTGADPSVYQSSIGNIDTRHDGMAMMFAEFTSGNMNATEMFFKGMFRFGTYLVAWHGTGAAYSNDEGASWTYFDPSGTGAKVNYMWTNGVYIYAAIDAGRVRKATSLLSWSDGGVNANSTDYKWICNHNGYVYFGKDAKNEVYYTSEEDLSDLAGIPADDPNVIYIGPTGAYTLGAISFMGDLYILNVKGEIYRLDHEELSGTKVLDLNAEVEQANTFRSWAIHNSYIIFTIGRNRVYQWNGSRLSDITPRPDTDVWPYENYYNYDHFTLCKSDLLCIGKRIGGRLDLICWDGVGWHTLITGLSSSQYGSILHYDSYAEKLYYQPTGTGVVPCQYLSFRSGTKFIQSGFPTTGSHYIITSKMDAGFRRVIKSTPSILVEGDHLTSSRYLKIYYSIDDANWVAWGGSDGSTNVVNTDGVTTLEDPLGTGDSTLEYYNIKFKILFYTNSSGDSPFLQSFTLRLIMRPNTNYGYSMNVVMSLSPEVGVGVIDDRTPKDMMDDLMVARASPAPISFTDPYGGTHKVYISALNRQLKELLTDKSGPEPQIEARVQVNMVEVG